ncbi:hypothetical protein DVH05_001199 [Phytophthora capsici]|nr:hypothetical protein DVH05_001199 [Phytophthora capsici]
MLLMAVLWKFPSPFGYVLVIVPYVVFLAIYTILGIGQDQVKHSPALRAQLKTQFVIIANQGLVVGCYALFSAVFNRLSSVQQAAFVFVMPLIKFFTKQNVANAAENYCEYVGPVVVFSVDLFNMYYAAICMQTAKSAITTAIIMAADIFHLVLALRTIFQGANSYKTKTRVQDLGNYLDELPQLLQTLFKEKKMKLSSKRNQVLRLVAPFPLPLSDESIIFMAELLKLDSHADAHRWPSKKCNKEGKQASNADSMPTKTMIKQTQILPVNSIVPKPHKASHATEETIQDALQKMFHSEYVLLSEYIEFVLPLLYAPYLAVLYHLPIAAYYPHTASMSPTQMNSAVRNILLFGMIEFVAFVILLAILRRRFGFSPLHQLAFVLETHSSALQGHLFVWTITILHLTLVHYGVDFNILTSL